MGVGRWEARIGIPGSKHIYLGLFNLEKEAAQAYDRALVRLRGTAAATNFALSDYRSDLAEYHKMQQVRLCSWQCGSVGLSLHSLHVLTAQTACVIAFSIETPAQDFVESHTHVCPLVDYADTRQSVK